MRDGEGAMHFHYLLWEDWRNGLYGNSLRDELVSQCSVLLTDSGYFGDTLRSVMGDWPIATAQHLSDVYRNHQPSCGRLACSYEFGATIREVNAAWAQLTLGQRLEANRVADDFTYSWRSMNMQGQMRWPV